MDTSRAIPQSGLRAWSIARHLPAIGVLLFGLTVVYAIGFSSLPLAHNATHDTRHANGFPCH